MRYKLSMRWRLTLMTALLVAAACIVLTVVISTSATVQLDQLGDYMFQVNGVEGETVEIGLDISSILSDIPDVVTSMKYRFRLQSFLFMICVVLAAGGGTYFLAGKMLKPLQKLNDQIGMTNAQNLSTPLEMPETHDEIAELTDSFNHMLERLNQVFCAQKQFTANAAHEFRTPLAVMQTKLDIFQKKEVHSTEEYSEIFQMIAGYIDRLRGLQDELLEMANMQTIERNDTIHLQSLLDEIFCDLADVAEEKDVKLVQSGTEGILKGNDALIYRAFYNLIENAIKYNVQGGEVRVETLQEGGRIFVKISDTGIGIPEDMREQVFEPFFRVDKSRSREMGGSGLGLALVRAIIEQHNGTVEIGKGEKNGTVVTVDIISDSFN